MPDNDEEKARLEKEKAVEKRGELLDSIEFAMGTPSKGAAIKLKAYVDFSKAKGETNSVQDKVDGLLKTHSYLKEKGYL